MARAAAGASWPREAEAERRRTDRWQVVGAGAEGQWASMMEEAVGWPGEARAMRCAMRRERSGGEDWGECAV